MQRWERDMGAREGGKSWMRGEERDNEAEGGGWPTAEKEREGRAHRGQKERDEELCGGVCPDLEHVVARCRLRPKIEPFFSAFLLLLLLLCCQRKGRGFLEGSSLPDTEQGEAAGALQRWTEEGLLGGGSPLWGGHGDGVRATFSGR